MTCSFRFLFETSYHLKVNTHGTMSRCICHTSLVLLIFLRVGYALCTLDVATLIGWLWRPHSLRRRQTTALHRRSWTPAAPTDGVKKCCIRQRLVVLFTIISSFTNALFPLWDRLLNTLMWCSVKAQSCSTSQSGWHDIKSPIRHHTPTLWTQATKYIVGGTMISTFSTSRFLITTSLLPVSSHELVNLFWGEIGRLRIGDCVMTVDIPDLRVWRISGGLSPSPGRGRLRPWIVPYGIVSHNLDTQPAAKDEMGLMWRQSSAWQGDSTYGLWKGGDSWEDLEAAP